MRMTRYEYNGFVVLYMCRTKNFSATSNHNAKRWTRSSLTANSRTKRWPSACRREMASRICGAYPVLDRGNEDTTAFQVSSSVSQLDDLHKASKTLAGVSIAITGMPDRTAEWTRKLISNALSRNICFVCFRCLRASPGSTNWTSGMGPDVLDRVGPCECDNTDVPDVSASIRFCSAICS